MTEKQRKTAIFSAYGPARSKANLTKLSSLAKSDFSLAGGMIVLFSTDGLANYEEVLEEAKASGWELQSKEYVLHEIPSRQKRYYVAVFEVPHETGAAGKVGIVAKATQIVIGENCVTLFRSDGWRSLEHVKEAAYEHGWILAGVA